MYQHYYVYAAKIKVHFLFQNLESGDATTAARNVVCGITAMTRGDGTQDPFLTPSESRQWLANSNTVSKPGNLVDGGPVTLEMYIPTTTFATPERLTSFGGTSDADPTRKWFFNLWI